MCENNQSAWWPAGPDSAVQAYLDAHYEFDVDAIESCRPYSGVSWENRFKSVPGTDAWKLRRDHIMNSLTADLIAGAELLGLPHNGSMCSGMPGGIGAEGIEVWMPFLDGGLWVEFTQYEDQFTNKVKAYQTTFIRGAMALRYLLSFLGFIGPRGRLKGEKKIPTESEIFKFLSAQKSPDAEEAVQLDLRVDNIRSETRILRNLSSGWKIS